MGDGAEFGCVLNLHGLWCRVVVRGGLSGGPIRTEEVRGRRYYLLLEGCLGWRVCGGVMQGGGAAD